MTHRLGASTMPEFFGARFQSKGLRIAAAAIIFVFLIPYTASVYNGLSRLFGMAFGLPYEWCVIGMAVITCIYAVSYTHLCHTQDDQSYLVGSLLGQASDSCIVEEHVRLMHSRLVFPRKTNQR